MTERTPDDYRLQRLRDALEDAVLELCPNKPSEATPERARLIEQIQKALEDTHD